MYETADETEKAVVKELGLKVLKLISKDISDGTSPYIGYFTDVDGGIFADLAYSKSG